MAPSLELPNKEYSCMNCSCSRWAAAVKAFARARTASTSASTSPPSTCSQKSKPSINGGSTRDPDSCSRTTDFTEYDLERMTESLNDCESLHDFSSAGGQWHSLTDVDARITDLESPRASDKVTRGFALNWLATGPSQKPPEKRELRSNYPSSGMAKPKQAPSTEPLSARVSSSLFGGRTHDWFARARTVSATSRRSCRSSRSGNSCGRSALSRSRLHANFDDDTSVYDVSSSSDDDSSVYDIESIFSQDQDDEPDDIYDF